MLDTKLDSPTEHALNKLQNTELSPMEEALFKSWAAANQIKKPDSADDPTDYRGIWKETGGRVLPYGQLQQFANRTKNEQTLVKALSERINAGEQAGEQQAGNFGKDLASAGNAKPGTGSST